MLNLQGNSKEELRLQLITLWRRQLMGATVAGAGAALGLAWQLGLVFAIGLGWGLIDDALIFRSAYAGLGLSPQASRRLLVRTLILRGCLAISLVLIMLQLKLNVAALLIGFILLHIFLIFNLSIFTGQNKKNSKAVRKGENEDGKC